LVDVSVNEARVKYRDFLTQPAGTYEPLVLPGPLHADEFRDLVRRHFADRPDLDTLEIRSADGEHIGFVTRDQISKPDRTAGEGLGDSQGATLPGESTGYRVVWFRCKRHHPAIWVPMAYYDQRYPPRCPQDPVHETEYFS
jgi:hypothetical protein